MPQYGRYSVRKLPPDENRAYRSGVVKIDGSGRRCCKILVSQGGGSRIGIADAGLRQWDLRVHTCHKAVIVPRLGPDRVRRCSALPSEAAVPPQRLDAPSPNVTSMGAGQNRVLTSDEVAKEALIVAARSGIHTGGGTKAHQRRSATPERRRACLVCCCRHYAIGERLMKGLLRCSVPRLPLREMTTSLRSLVFLPSPPPAMPNFCLLGNWPPGMYETCTRAEILT